MDIHSCRQLYSLARARRVTSRSERLLGRTWRHAYRVGLDELGLRSVEGGNTRRAVPSAVLEKLGAICQLAIASVRVLCVCSAAGARAPSSRSRP